MHWMPLNCYNDLTKWVLLLSFSSLSYRLRNWGSQGLTRWSKDAQQLGGQREPELMSPCLSSLALPGVSCWTRRELLSHCGSWSCCIELRAPTSVGSRRGPLCWTGENSSPTGLSSGMEGEGEKHWLSFHLSGKSTQRPLKILSADLIPWSTVFHF